MQGKLNVRLTGLTEADRGRFHHALIQIREGERLVKQARVSPPVWAGNEASFALPFQPPDEREYTVRAVICDGAGTALDSISGTCRQAPMPWLGNQLGLAPVVIPGFTPLKVQGRTLSVWGREYVLGATGFPSAISSASGPVLAGPVRLVAVDGSDKRRELTASGSGVALSGKTSTDVQLQASLGTGASTASLGGSMAYDGFVEYRLKFGPQTTAGARQLSLEIPLTTAKFLHCVRDSMRENSEWLLLPLTQGVIWDSGQVANKTVLGSFVPFVWIGDEKRGLYWSADSDRGWRTDPQRPCLELIRQGNAVTLRINFLSGTGAVSPVPLAFISFDFRAEKSTRLLLLAVVGDIPRLRSVCPRTTKPQHYSECSQCCPEHVDWTFAVVYSTPCIYHRVIIEAVMRTRLTQPLPPASELILRCTDMARTYRRHAWSAVAMTAVVMTATMCVAQLTRAPKGTTVPEAAPTPSGQPHPTTKLPTTNGPSAQVETTGALKTSAQATVQARYVGLVSWSYLRMHQPGLIVGMVQDVQAGKLSGSALNGLASPAVLTQLLGARWDLATIHGDPRQLKTSAGGQQPAANAMTRNMDAGGNSGELTQAAPASSTSRVMSRTGQSGPSPWELVRETGASRTVIGFPDYAPKQIDFAPLWDRQTSRLRLHLTALADGPITAALPEGGPFRIFSMSTYDGPWQGAETGGAAPTRQQLMVTARRISSGRISPPWTVDATAGQDVTIVIAFAPDSFKTTVGDVNTVLQVTGNASTPSSLLSSSPTPSDVASITSSQPEGAAVAPDAKICINFSQAMKPKLTEAAFWVRKDGTPPNVPGTFAWVGNEMQFTPTPALASLTTYQVSVAATAKLATGAALGHKLSWRFTTRPPGPSGPAQPTVAPRWTLKVPVRGRFEGLNFGVLFMADNQNLDLILPVAYYPNQPQAFEMSVKLTNTNAAASGVLRAESLPSGVSMAPVNLSLPQNATITQTLPFEIDRSQRDNVTNEPNGVPYPIVLRFDANGKTSWLNLSLTVHPGLYYWTTGLCTTGSVDYHAKLSMDVNGNFRFSVDGVNHHLINSYLVSFRGGFDDREYFNMAVPVGRFEGTFMKSYGFQAKVLQNQYLSLIQKPLVVHVGTEVTLNGPF